jgi:hypothetical protein
VTQNFSTSGCHCQQGYDAYKRILPGPGNYRVEFWQFGVGVPEHEVWRNTYTAVGDNDRDGFTTCSGDCNDNDPSINPNTIWYKDADNDGYSDGSTLKQCPRPAGYRLPSELTQTSGDCNDNNSAVHAIETWYLDADNDGHYISSQSSCGSPGTGYTQTAGVQGDCDDNDNTKWQTRTLFIDGDGDGYDNGTATVCYGAVIPTGYSTSTLGSDCDDNDNT